MLSACNLPSSLYCATSVIIWPVLTATQLEQWLCFGRQNILGCSSYYLCFTDNETGLKAVMWFAYTHIHGRGKMWSQLHLSSWENSHFCSPWAIFFFTRITLQRNGTNWKQKEPVRVCTSVLQKIIGDGQIDQQARRECLLESEGMRMWRFWEMLVLFFHSIFFMFIYEFVMLYTYAFTLFCWWAANLFW